MLKVNSVSFIQFRNYLDSSFSFNERIVAICGKNGTGKTNLLDAVYYLCFTKSYFGRTDASSAQHGLTGFRINGKLTKATESYSISSIFRDTGKKELWVDDEPIKKFSTHLGKFPAVMIAPDDVLLITGGSEERRKWMDTILSQTNAIYLNGLIDYQKILQQRNSHLKFLAENNSNDYALLQVLNEQLAAKASLLYPFRKSFMQAIIKSVDYFYTVIAGTTDDIRLTYNSALHNSPLLQLLQENQQKDIILQRTSHGIHKDEIVFQLGDYSFKTEASQGQRKSLLFALKLAEWDYLKEHLQLSPILLLDDVFEKLDETRMQQLLHWICNYTDSQVLITDTHEERIGKHLNRVGLNFQIISL